MDVYTGLNKNQYDKLISLTERLDDQMESLCKVIKSAIGGGWASNKDKQGKPPRLSASAAKAQSAVETFMDSSLRLARVQSKEDHHKAVQTAGSAAREGFVNRKEALNIQYVLDQNGIAPDLARESTGVIGKIAKVSGGGGERVAALVAKTYKAFGAGMGGSELEKIQRIGELFAGVQNKFEFGDFETLGAGLEQALAHQKKYNADLAQSLTLIGYLNSADIGPVGAENSFGALLGNLNKAQGVLKKELNMELIKKDDGSVDLLGTLEALKKATAGMASAEKSALLQNIFGQAGAVAAGNVLANLDHLKKDVADVKAESVGVYANLLKVGQDAPSGKLETFRNALENLGRSFGPQFQPIVDGVAGMADGLVEKFPIVGKGLSILAATGEALEAGDALIDPFRKPYDFFKTKIKGKSKPGLSGGITKVFVTNWPGSGVDYDDFGGGGGGKKKKGRRSKAAKRRLRRMRTGRGGGRLGRMLNAGRSLWARSGGRVFSKVGAVGASMAGGLKAAGRNGLGLVARGGSMLAAKVGLGGLAKTGTKAAAKGGLKAAGKVGIKALGKSAVKKIPGVGLLAGVGMGIGRALDGDWLGALGEVGSGLLSMVPGIGTAASVAIDAALAARDMANASDTDSEPASESGIPRAQAQLATAQGQVISAGAPQVSIQQTNTFPSGDQGLLEQSLAKSNTNLIQLVERAVNEMWARNQRTSFGNVSA